MHSKCTLPVLLLFIFSAIETTAQDSSFQLKDYKYRTPGFRSLQIDFNLHGSAFDSKVANWQNTQSRSFNTSPDIYFYRAISTDKRQHTSSIVLNPSYSSNFSKTDLSKTRNRAASLSFNWNQMDRFYLKKNFFFEAGNDFSVGGNNNRATETSTQRDAETRQFYDKLSLGVGKGRLENVQDAQMALFIVNDLKKMGLLQQDLPAEKINELAKLITAINNQRVFDSRIRRIYELTRIDSFFRANDLIKGSSIAYFTTVNDNWALAFNPGRQAGKFFYFRFRPSVQWRRNMAEQNAPGNKYKSYNRDFFYAYEPVVGFEKQQPVNLYWQRSMGASLSFVQEWQRSKSQYESSGIPPQQPIYSNSAGSAISLNSFYELGYYPNNRTTINGGLHLNYQYDLNNTTGQKGIFYIEPGLFLNAGYFVNYRTRVSLNAAAYYRYFEFGTVPPPPVAYQRSVFDGNISLGFSHIIF